MEPSSKNITPIHPPHLFTFGERVNVLEKLVRTHTTRVNELADSVNAHEYWGTSRSIKRDWKIWEYRPCIRRNCIFLGYRTLRNGVVSYSNEEGHYFNVKEYFKAALVALNDKEKPIYVPLDCITPFVEPVISGNAFLKSQYQHANAIATVGY